MGSATIVLLVVSFMLLRAKGRDIGAGDPASLPSADKTEPHSGGQPPSPPEDPETESGAKKRRNRWPFVLLYLLIVTVLLSLGAAFFSVHLIRSHRLVVPHPIAYGLLAIEGGSSYIWIVAVSAFSLYRRPVLLALASHLVCITLKLALRRAWPHLRPFLGDDAIGCIWVPLAINIISSRLNWVYGMPYYHHGYSVVFTMTQSLNRLFASGLKFLARFEPSDDLTFIVPLVFHAATTVLFACLSGIRAILYSSNENRLLHVIGWPMRCAFFTAFFFVPQAMLQLLCGFIDLAPNLKIRIFIAPFSRASREKIRAAFWGRYPRWHSVESKGLSRLKSELFHLFMRAVWWCWGVWCTLSWAQKLLIIAPAAIFYAFHIVQWARGCWRRRSQSRERWRRGLVDD
ncbi:hypothetical protein C8R46DRAFT_1081052 [Mycena filopes]|nr:hypothetical protein C8R46DRAFT_1081052 [Mycena filopes]